jgi:hypothetical protein
LVIGSNEPGKIALTNFLAIIALFKKQTIIIPQTRQLSNRTDNAVLTNH